MTPWLDHALGHGMRFLLPTLLTVLLLAVPLLVGGAPALASSLQASAQDAAQGGERVVVEHLRLRVPAGDLQAWREAEQASWQPWLAAQPGFLQRQLLWDPEREEGTLLIHWRSREHWKAIPPGEVAGVQERFERLARQATGRSQGNPFPLLFEGELQPQ
jgi:uncharacterized protein (TIGR03792 family)